MLKFDTPFDVFDNLTSDKIETANFWDEAKLT